MPAKVEYLKKITLSLDSGSVSGPESTTESFSPIEFVFGLSASGLTPFEYALAEKSVGDEIQLQLHRNDMPEFFGHIRIPDLQAAGHKDTIALTARILEITPASNQEVIKALADIANCGDSCCGQH